MDDYDEVVEILELMADEKEEMSLEEEETESEYETLDFN